MGSIEHSSGEWHASVDAHDVERTTRAVGDPVVVMGPRGAGPISPMEFAGSVERSGITLPPLSWHPGGDDLMVAEQDAAWPGTRPRRRWPRCSG